MGSVKLHIKKSDNDKKKIAGIIDLLFKLWLFCLKMTIIVDPLTMIPMKETMNNPMKATMDQFSLISLISFIFSNNTNS